MQFTKAYFDNTEHLSSSALLRYALTLTDDHSTALDLGCGTGRDTKLLLEHGFYVTAVDQEPLAHSYIDKLRSPNKLTFVLSSFEDFVFSHYDLVNAQYSLPFTHPDLFETVFQNVISSLEPQGIFAGQLFGINDEWNGLDSNITFHDRESAQALFSTVKLLHFSEHEYDGTLASGAKKHWHYFDIIAQKEP